MNIQYGFRGLIMVMVCFFFVSCNPTEIHAQSPNNEQRLIGRWVDEFRGATWIFNSNGTGSRDGHTFMFGAASGKLILYGHHFHRSEDRIHPFDFYVSSDGNTIILIRNGWTTSTGSFVLRKSN